MLIPPPPSQELFIANSQKYARETVLSRRICDWEDKMGPLLQEQVRPFPCLPRGGLGPALALEPF